jgi:hypothetical protein
MYRDLPGGTMQLRAFARMSRLYIYQIFHCLTNPGTTLPVGKIISKAWLTLLETEADGVVLLLEAAQSYELRQQPTA